MIQINKAIVHVLDYNSGVTVFSEEEMDVDSDIAQGFLKKHLLKSMEDGALVESAFLPDSGFAEHLQKYLDGQLTFREFSTLAAQVASDAVSKVVPPFSTDLILCDFILDEARYFGVLFCNNRIGYTHTVIQDGGRMKNEIIKHYSILPSPSQRIESCAFVDIRSGQIKYADKPRSIDGQEVSILPDLLLGCTRSLSPKESVKIVNTIVEKIAEEHGQNTAEVLSKAKNYLVETSESGERVQPAELGAEIFDSSPAMQAEFAEEVKRAGVPEAIPVDRKAVQVNRTHKIRTDTGIEISFPVDYFDNQDYMEFVNNPDGTISIQLKNIGKIINR